MAAPLVAWAGYLALLLMAGAVVVTVDRRERYVFAGGVVLLLLGLALLGGTPGAALAFLGVIAIVGASIPLLREPAPST